MISAMLAFAEAEVARHASLARAEALEEAAELRALLQQVRDCRTLPGSIEIIHGSHYSYGAWSVSNLTKLLPAIDEALIGKEVK